MFSSPIVRWAASGWPLLAILTYSPVALAQPTQVPSNIKKPTFDPFGGLGAPAPEPAPISLEQLRALKGGPTLVTFSGQDVPSGDAVKALLGAAQITSFSDLRPQTKKVSVDWKQTPFWSAAADLERQTGLIWRLESGSKLSLNQNVSLYSGGIDGKVALQNPYVLMIATSVSHTTTERVSFAQKPQAPDANYRRNNSRAYLDFSLYFDPKLPVESFLLRGVTYLRAGGNAPIPEDFEDIKIDGYSSSGSLISSLSYGLPQIAAGTTFSRISGTLHTVIATAIEPFQVADLAAANKITKVIGQNQFTVNAATVTGNSISIQLSASAAAAVAGQNRASLPPGLFSALRVRDALGNELQIGGLPNFRGGGEKTEGTFIYTLKNANGDVAPGPYSLEWPITTETRSFDVPFAVRDITVP